MALRAQLAHTTVHGYDGNAVTLAVPDRTNADILKANIGALRAAFDGVLGRSLEIRVIVENGRSTSPPAEQPDDEQPDLVRYAIETLP
jgi:hypothetical protein